MRSVVLPLSAAVALGTGGCGSGGDYKNNLRPPAPIDVGAAITSKGISVSPSHFGAGPIVLVITNQSGVSQEVRLRGGTANSKCYVDQKTAPINPQDTAEVKVNLCQGTYSVGASAGGVRPAQLAVGASRESAQNQVLQP